MSSVKAAKPAQSMPETIIADAIAGLVGSEVMKDSEAATVAMITLRQVVIALERHQYASKSHAEKCFELISIMERKG